MDLRDEEYKKKGLRAGRQQVWVSYAVVSEHLKKAILISEDAAFFSHKGIDVNELKAALKKDWETLSFSRGGSTITMQLAKNLYLSPSKNPLRKLREMVIAQQLERTLPKQRIFELYLNIVEWGRNVYGAEAGRAIIRQIPVDLDPSKPHISCHAANPRNSKERSLLNRRNLILTRLASVGYLNGEELRRLGSYRSFKKSKKKPASWRRLATDTEPISADQPKTSPISYTTFSCRLRLMEQRDVVFAAEWSRIDARRK